MKKIVFIIISTLFSLNIIAQKFEPDKGFNRPTNNDLRMKSYDADTTANAVVLYQLTTVNFDFIESNFVVTTKVKKRIKILTDYGKSYGDIKIPLINHAKNGNSDEYIDDIKVKIYNINDNGEIKAESISPKPFQERINNDYIYMKFAVPNIMAGTVFDYEYTIRSKRYWEIRTWYAQEDIPTIFSQYDLKIPLCLVFNIEGNGLDKMDKKFEHYPRSIQIGNQKFDMHEIHHLVTVKDMPAFNCDDFVMCKEDYIHKIEAEFCEINLPGILNKRYTTTWEDVDQTLLKDVEYSKRVKETVLQNEVINSNVSSLPSIEEKIGVIYRLLMSKVSWNGKYGIYAESADKVLKRGTGNNAELNFMLINMLREIGIKAQPVVLRLRNSGKIPVTHPTVDAFNAMVVKIDTEDNGFHIFDCSSNFGSLDMIHPLLLSEKAHVVNSNKNGEWLNLQKLAKAKKTISIIADLDSDGNINGEYITSYRDLDAMTIRNKIHNDNDRINFIKTLESSGITINSYKVDGLDDFTSVVTDTINFCLRCSSAGNYLYLHPVLFPPITDNPFKTETRSTPIELPYAINIYLNATITIPEGYIIEDAKTGVNGRNFSDDKNIADGHIFWSVDNSVLRVNYKFNLKKTIYSPAEYATLKSIYDQIIEYSNTYITLKKTASN